jgi:tetratricopeptide (TPR) repeat protein/predicted Ser/Thr protein kinase
MRWELIARTKPVFDALTAGNLDGAALMRMPAVERAAAVSERCGGDAELAEAVLQLIEDIEEDPEFLATPLPERFPLPVSAGAGHLVGDYRLIEEIGHGGHGTVFLAERADGMYGQRVAVKMLRAWTGAGTRHRRFGREVRILAGLQHPGIVRLLDGGVTREGSTFLVMEHVDGVPLVEYCRASELDLRGKVRLMAEVCEAVAFAHRKLVIHRDLKPGNLLVDSAGRPKLLDFGVAKLLADEEEGAAATTLAEPAGMTWAYASPEQLEGRPVLSTAVDQYALGVMLYELVCGKRPWQDLERSTARMSRAVLEEEVPRPSSLVPRLDRDLEAILLRCLAREPDGRYPSVDDLQDDLHRFLAGEPVAARPVPVWVRAWRVGRRNRLVTGLACLAVAFGAALGWAWVDSHNQERRQLERDLALARCQRATQLSGDLPRRIPPELGPAIREAAESMERLTVLGSLPKSDLQLFADYAATLGSVAGHPAATASGDLAVTERILRAGIRLSELAAPKLPEDESFLLGECFLRHSLAGVLVEAGRYDEAEAVLRPGIAIEEKVRGSAHAYPSHAVRWQMYRADMYATLSRVVLHRGRIEETIALRREAVEVSRRLYREHPELVSQDRTLAGMKAALAWALRESGDLTGALRELEEARELLADALLPGTFKSDWTSIAARGLYEEGRILLDMGRPAEGARRLGASIEAMRRVRELAPLTPMIDRTLMRALARQAEAGRRLGWAEKELRVLGGAAVEEARRVREANRANAKVPGEVEEVREALRRAGLPVEGL